MAAQTALKTISSGNVSSESLKEYQINWYKTKGKKLDRNYRIRSKFPYNSRADKNFVRSFMLAVSGM